MMMLATILTVALWLTAQDAAPAVEDRWVSMASPETMTRDPCDASFENQTGTSVIWMLSTLVEWGHPQELVCGVSEEFAAGAVAKGTADWLDLQAQVMARLTIALDALPKGRGEQPVDGWWTAELDAQARQLYFQLKQDDYKQLMALLDEFPAEPIGP